MVAYLAAYVGWVSFVCCADNFRCPNSMAKLPGDLEKGMRIVCCAHNLMPSFGQACAKSRSGRNVSDCLLHLSWTKAKKSWVKAKKKWAVDAVYWAVDAEMASFSITMRSWVKKRKWASGEGEGEGEGGLQWLVGGGLQWLVGGAHVEARDALNSA